MSSFLHDFGRTKDKHNFWRQIWNLRLTGRCLLLIDGEVVAGVAESGPDRVVDVEDVGHRGPGVRVGRGGGGGAVLGVDGAEGAVDLEEAEHGRGAGAALKPHHNRRLGGIHFL